MSVGDVAEARARRQPIAQERKGALEGQVQREKGRILESRAEMTIVISDCVRAKRDAG